MHREPTSTTRKGDYFRGEVPFNNSTGALWLTITNVAVLSNYTGADIVTNIAGNMLLAKTPEAFGYDADGTLTNDSVWSYTWDAENRLIKQESVGSLPAVGKRRLEFAYDHQSRRIQKLVSTNSGANYWAQYTNRFVYDGWNPLAILKPQSSIVQSFTWGLDLSGLLQGAGGVGGLLAVNDAANGVHFCASDGNGNVAALMKATAGTVSASYEYGPFGEVLRATGPMAKPNPFRFSTKYQDDETDQLYYGYRSYNPSTGRWLNRDPLTEKGGRNLYAFVRNNPVSRFDILGLAGVETAEDAKRLCQAQIDKPPGEQPQITGPAPASECANALQILFTDPELKKLWGKFGDKCPPPFFKCLCCSPKGFSGAFIPPRPGEARMVYLCWNNLKDSPSEFKKTLLHELTHAVQDCKGGDVDCKESLKREMEAYKAEGSCSDFSSCLEAAIRSSCAKGGFCSDANDAAAAFDELKSWFNAEAGNASGFRAAPSFPAAGRSYSRSCSTCF